MGGIEVAALKDARERPNNQMQRTRPALDWSLAADLGVELSRVRGSDILA
jgi:hypothetical protein